MKRIPAPDYFTVKIELGNEAMQSYVDVANALKKVAIRVGVGDAYGKIMDRNGNSVGKWEFQ
jgi:hypothetical protein